MSRWWIRRLPCVRRRGRVTDRTLQFQFQLDDAQLGALKDELLTGKPLAADEAGAVLVWMGETAQPPVSPPSPASVLPPLAASRSRALPRRNATGSLSCSVTWWTRPYSPASLIPKSCARSSEPIKTPVSR